MKHLDQSSSTRLKDSEERKIHFYPIEIYSEKIMT